MKIRDVQICLLSQIFFPFALGYYFSYLYRSVNAVIAADLVVEFNLSASDLGLLTSIFFLTFASIQIPVGLMLDRFGPRRTNTFFLMLGAFGAFLFARAGGFSDLLVARAVIGAGFAAALMSSFKVFTIWFPVNWLPAMNGCVFFCGGIGAISATLPVIALLEFTDWRGLFYMASISTTLVALSVFFVVPEKSNQKPNQSLVEQLSGVGEVFSSIFFWRIAIATTVLSASNMAVQTLWAAPWLMDVAGLSRNEIGGPLLILGLSTMIGFLFWGALATRLLAVDIQPITVFKWGSGVFVGIQALLVVGFTQNLSLLWAGYGFFGTVGSLAYVILSRGFPQTLGGRVNTALNLLVFTAAFTIQWIFGIIVNNWPQANGLGYHPTGYGYAFLFFLLLQLPGFLWICFSRNEKDLAIDVRENKKI